MCGRLLSTFYIVASIISWKIIYFNVWDLYVFTVVVVVVLVVVVGVVVVVVVVRVCMTSDVSLMMKRNTTRYLMQ